MKQKREGWTKCYRFKHYFFLYSLYLLSFDRVTVNFVCKPLDLTLYNLNKDSTAMHRPIFIEYFFMNWIFSLSSFTFMPFSQHNPPLYSWIFSDQTDMQTILANSHITGKSWVHWRAASRSQAWREDKQLWGGGCTRPATKMPRLCLLVWPRKLATRALRSSTQPLSVFSAPSLRV